MTCGVCEDTLAFGRIKERGSDTHDIIWFAEELLIVHDQDIEDDLEDLQLELFRRRLYLAEEELERVDGHVLEKNDVIKA